VVVGSGIGEPPRKDPKEKTRRRRPEGEAPIGVCGPVGQLGRSFLVGHVPGITEEGVTALKAAVPGHHRRVQEHFMQYLTDVDAQALSGILYLDLDALGSIPEPNGEGRTESSGQFGSDRRLPGGPAGYLMAI
jgi:hypothetical protein